ncbi:hypothetical protein ANO11243_011130 [Dothideomycetidae sp. 11243]|nr:hypothetical protein ANO11243_011130 [fungal sp. No.11243]
MSTPAGDRLSTIMEGSTSSVVGADNKRYSGKSWSSSSPPTLPRVSAEPTPPPYAREWQAEGANYQEKRGLMSWKARLKSRRGGWSRSLLVLIAVLLLLVIALAIGLGVGLTQHHKSSTSTASGNGESSDSGANHQFPIGEYTFVTALREEQTGCTANAATWRCYPYSTYSSDGSTSGLTLFNWVLSTSSSTIASNSTPPTTNSVGIPANISISSTNNPFNININNQSLTFINNDSNPRYTFSFPYSQEIVPTTPLNGNDSATTCIYSNTFFSATLYLSNTPAKQYPGATLQNSTQVSGGYTPWPFAVDISESAVGGQNVPQCYEVINGSVGQRITGLAAQPSDQRCLCHYSNYDD